MAGVQAHSQALAPAGRLQQRGELVERAPERAASARRVLEVQLTALALLQRLPDRLPGAGDRLADVAGLRRAGVQDDAARADRLADTQGMRERGERLGADRSGCPPSPP